MMIDRIEALLAFDRRKEIAGLSVPTLVVGALDDLVVPPHLWRAIADALPEAQLRELPVGGHFAPIVAPEAYRDAIAPFLLKTTPGS